MRASTSATPVIARRLRIVLLVFAVLGAMAACSGTEPTVTPTTSTPGGASTPAASSSGGSPPSQAQQLVAGMTDTELVGQVLMPSIAMSDSPASASALVRKYHLGGVIVMGNVQDTSAEATATQVRKLTDALRGAAQPSGAGLVPLIATDQEYGWVTRIKSGVVQLPSAMAFGAAGRPELTENAWRGAGAELAAVGINVDFAPDADVLGPASNYVIGSRSFGSDAAAVAGQVAAAVKGLQSAGVAATLKHFPGHGHTSVNSHDALPVLSQSVAKLTANDLPPFQSGVDAGAWLVMSGHLDVRALDPGMPATFSPKVLVDLLRTKMGFTGVVVTDALNMQPARRWAPGEAAVRAFLAGNDVLLMPPDLGKAQQGLLAAVKSGRIPRQRLVDSVTRIVSLKLRLGAFPPPPPGTLDSAEHRDAARAAAAAAITVVKGACGEPLVRGPVRVTASAGRSHQVRWLSDALRAQGVEVTSNGGSEVHLVGYADAGSDLAPQAAVTVAMDTPYLLHSAASPVLVATYSSTQASMQALAAVLAGTTPAPGRSPVTVSGLPRSACVS